MATMLVLLLTLTLGMAQAGKLFYEVEQQQQQQLPSDSTLCPDQVSKCPNTATCCKLSSGEWGCCSHASAAFLSETPAAEKLPANVLVADSADKTTQSPVGKVRCDSTYYCQNGQTCCPLPNGTWGCCPYSGATCCVGSKYCCRSYQKCSNPPGRCY